LPAVTTIKAEAAPFFDAFRALPRPKGEPRWLAARREGALARFGELGFPTRRDEAWRFTDLRPLQRVALPPQADGGTLAPETLARWRLAEGAHRLVFVNGRLSPEASDIGDLPEGAWLAAASRTLAERPDLLEQALEASDTDGAQPFASLNAAFFADGFVLALAPGVVLRRPVEIVTWTSAAAPKSVHLRNLVLLGEDSGAAIIETAAGEGLYWTNAVTAVRLAAGARLEHVKLQDEGPDAIHFATVRAALGAGADYRSFALTLGARLSRQDTLAALAAAAAHLQLDGAYLLRGAQEATSATFVDHQAPGGTTRELWKGVVEDRAHGVFLGKIAVRPEAQKTDAHQLSRSLLLSPRAAVDSKPELEILADDVKCSHGAAVGDLDEAQLFYLESRGVPPEEARRMLIEAFAMEALERVAAPALRAHLAAELQRRLGGGMA
jgi:Fe-S cluster assembly protein SufD